MTHPPYHLRPNKAADRFMLVEVLRVLAEGRGLSGYTYYGLGGPFLDDFRMMRDFFPKMRLVCIEREDNTHKRQKFHLPARGVSLRKCDVAHFINWDFDGGEKEVFWLDYVELAIARLGEFMTVLGKVGDESIVKVTVPAKPPYAEPSVADIEDFRRQYEEFAPADLGPSRFTREAPFAKLVQDMFQIAAQKALPAVTGRTFQVICSTRYRDGAPMFTLTGIVSALAGAKELRALYRRWPLANLDWGDPRYIDVPILSVKERLRLERHLPCRAGKAGTLANVLGYRIDDDEERSRAGLEQYAQFHRYSPYFAKILV